MTVNREEEHFGGITLVLILTPPTLSKWSPSFSKSIRCPLNDQVNMISSEWSWDTWQGRTILSPTVTSMLKGDTITRVGSTNEGNREKKISPVFLRKGGPCGAENDPTWSITIVALELFQKKMNYHIFDFILTPFSFCWIETLSRSLPESSSSCSPDEQGEKKKMEKNATDSSFTAGVHVDPLPLV